MGILKSREELLPVTCAILKEEDRKDFFSRARQKPAGKPAALAKLLGVPPAVVSDWESGRSNIPYHALRRMAHELEVEMPPVAELRRESLPVIMSPPPPVVPFRAGKAPAEKARAAREPRRPKRQARAPARRAAKPREKPAAREGAKSGARRGGGKPGAPKLSADLAYWVGASLAGAALRDDAFVFTADRRTGQNFAATWARKTHALFGIKSRLSMKDGGKAQEAAVSAAELEGFVSRLGLASGAEEDAGLPRWIWSNPEWKKACLKGLMDAGGRFQKTPALVLEIKPEFSRAAVKMFRSLDFQARQAAGGALALQGPEPVRKYFETVGTENLKLKDQLKSYFVRGGSGRPQAAGGAEDAGEPEAPAIESAPDEAAGSEPAAAPPEEAGPVQPAPADAHPKPRRPVRRKRTLYRGRPGPGL